jgi:hypothetical protein
MLSPKSDIGPGQTEVIITRDRASVALVMRKPDGPRLGVMMTGQQARYLASRLRKAADDAGAAAARE